MPRPIQSSRAPQSSTEGISQSTPLEGNELVLKPPAPHRKVRPNEPCYVPVVAKFLAAKRGVDEQQFIERVDANAVNVCQIRSFYGTGKKRLGE